MMELLHLANARNLAHASVLARQLSANMTRDLRVYIRLDHDGDGAAVLIENTHDLDTQARSDLLAFADGFLSGLEKGFSMRKVKDSWYVADSVHLTPLGKADKA